ncbi:hypothetical protein KQI41_14800 [Tissierella pigra]|uniref:Uncharacterized protein n=1 Tax=Tissierella pigra TaxID=2607614 RepID=A0A6N7XF97_9FIRM|nr:hypothetical protein [Tissierella pigra]MBU5427656.1 hypothetical protein [Tissierella pigra]MSU00406.1 hypothetical protein [Tissierella pigra]
MGNSWSGLRRELENDYLCESLQGRVQYFVTHYHKAPDNYGRIAVRVDGKEVLMGNPYDYYVKGYVYKQHILKKEMGVQPRKWVGNETLNDKENKQVEDMVNEMAVNDGVFDIDDITSSIREYKNLDIKESINSANPLVRMLAVMDRRIGKRTLTKLKSEVDKQPEWLQFFYNLRLESENLF